MDQGQARAEFIETALQVKDRQETNAVLLVTDRKDFAELTLKHFEDPVVLVSSRQELYVELDPLVRSTIALSRPVEQGMELFSQVKEVLVSAFVNGSLGPEDRVLVLGFEDPMLRVLSVFDLTTAERFTQLRDELADRADLSVVEKVLQVAMQLSTEGREGKPVGALFILGDTRKVLKSSRQVVVNPFEGHDEDTRNIVDPDTWETVKEFAQIDGAFIIRGDGVIEAAGRYVDIDRTVDLPAGLGGRHLAAASISRTTKSIAIAVSASGAIRLFKNGEVLLKVGPI